MGIGSEINAADVTGLNPDQGLSILDDGVRIFLDSDVFGSPEIDRCFHCSP
jgi:hypothetical protein